MDSPLLCIRCLSIVQATDIPAHLERPIGICDLCIGKGPPTLNEWLKVLQLQFQTTQAEYERRKSQ